MIELYLIPCIQGESLADMDDSKYINLTVLQQSQCCVVYNKYFFRVIKDKVTGRQGGTYELDELADMVGEWETLLE